MQLKGKRPIRSQLDDEPPVYNVTSKTAPQSNPYPSGLSLELSEQVQDSAYARNSPPDGPSSHTIFSSLYPNSSIFPSMHRYTPTLYQSFNDTQRN